MTDVGSPKYLMDQSLVVPKEGITITSPLHLAGRVEISGGGPIFLKGEGRIVVSKNSHVVLRNASIEVSAVKAADGDRPTHMIAVEEGRETSLSFEDSSMVVDIPYEKDTSSAPWDQPPKYWAVGISRVGADPANVVRVTVRNTRFINRQAYAAGALDFWRNAQVVNAAILKGEIVENEFENFHGVISVNNMKGFKVSENRLVRNSFHNIFVSGEGVLIKDNKVYYPGNGTTGDGVTVLGKFVSSKIEGNTIFVGSCFGVLMRGGELSNFSVERNTIINGVTTAIQIEGATNKATGVSVKNNVISGNYGFAITLLRVEDATIESNDFSDNAKGFPSQIYVEESSRVVLNNNFSAIALTPEWAKGLKLYRSHVKSDDSSFTLPGAHAN
ncbi:MAG: right-handed parallel beta-helix repeat-containing protein [Hafnia sp.]